MRLDETDLKQAKAHLLGEKAEPLIRYMAQQSVATIKAELSDDIQGIARDLGWIDPVTGQRTEVGIFVSDSCREYLFWLERGRTLPFLGKLPHLGLDRFEAKDVVEIGAGMGTHLMSLNGISNRLCGLEPVEAYAQLGRIFCQREEITPPDIQIGAAEALPFADAEFDLVLCVTAHQYFDVCPALAEMARILKPGGELVLVGAHLSGYARKGRRVWRSIRDTRAYGITLVNTLSYMVMRRRIIGSRSRFSTSRPIYPSRRAMRRWMAEVGLEQAASPHSVGGDSCFYARKRV